MMGKEENLQLFKEWITLTDYDVLIKELSDAIDEGTPALTKILFGTETPDLYSNHGAYRPGQHNHCVGLNTERFTEKRLCKCMYYLNSIHTKRCDNCAFRDRFDVVGNYKITDYEVPAFYYGNDIGEIDLIINSPVGDDSEYDDSYLRKAAIKAKVSYITTVAAARVAAEGIHYVKTHKGSELKSLQELHREICHK